MANFFNTRVHKVKEALGTVQATADPQPVLEVKEHMKNVKDNVSNVQRASKQLSMDYSKAAQSGDKLGESFVDFSKLYEKSPLGEVLSRCGEVQIALNALEHAYASETIEILASPLKRIQDEELKKAFDLKTKQEEKRVAYDVVLNKHREFTAKSDGKTTPKGDELEQSLNVAKAAYDTLNQQLINRLNDFDQEASTQLITNIIAFLKAQQEHYTKAANLLNEVLPQFQSLENQNQNFIQQMKEHSYLLKQQQAQAQLQPPPPLPQSHSSSLPVQSQQNILLNNNNNNQIYQSGGNINPNVIVIQSSNHNNNNNQPPLPQRSSQQFTIGNNRENLSSSSPQAPLYPNVPSGQAPLYPNINNNNNNTNNNNNNQQPSLYPNLQNSNSNFYM